MKINCNQIVEKYLLNQNPLYSFNLPLSILITIIVFGFAKANKWSENSYINQILIPLVTLLLSLVVIDLIARCMINKNKKNEMAQLCAAWMNNPSNKGKVDFLFDSYESFSNQNKESSDEESNNDSDNTKEENIESFTSYTGQPMNKKVDYENNVNTTKNLTMDLSTGQPYNSVHNLIDEIPNLAPAPLQSVDYNAECIQNSNCCNICSGGKDGNVCNLVAPIPGPQWMPQTAENVQNRLKNNDYTKNSCPLNL